ncbi:MAG: DUF1801 domain-containing protein [Bacteroidetes bacterium]|nr:DUF1801 domain-containing protein [Bacteroidota bacterium]MBS1939808.1 DUF1801 domain-containing protein [Bacteroidota bacterium]
MSLQDQIDRYIGEQPGTRQSDLRALHQLALKVMPGCKLWYLDGKDAKGKVVSNPNIGYGTQTMKYADGGTKEFYRIGLSANTTGISVYIMGHADKSHLANTYGQRLGKASITGYCIKFKTLKDINLDVLEEVIRGRARMTA